MDDVIDFFMTSSSVIDLKIDVHANEPVTDYINGLFTHINGPYLTPLTGQSPILTDSH